MSELDADAYRTLFEANPRPMFVADRETLQILIVNQAACEHYGWSREELLAMTLREIRPPEEIQRFEHAFADTSKDPRSTYSRAGRHRTKDGRILDVSLEISGLMLGGRPASLAIVTDVTGVAQVERRFKLLVERSVDGIAVTNAENVVEYISPGGRRILGYEDEDGVGKSAFLRTHPDDVSPWQAPEPGATRYHVSRLQHLDGSWRWIESSTTNLTHDPAVRAYVSNYRDVTERTLAESALVESQRRLEFLLSATSAITYTARASGDYRATFISANIQDVLGHCPADFYGDPAFWRRNIHADDLPMVKAKIQQLARGESFTLDYRFRHRDGTDRWMRDVARLVRDPISGEDEVVGYWIDVTEQVGAATSLQRSEGNFRRLIERAPTATFVHRHGRYVYVNPAAVAMLGYQSAGEIVGRPVLDFIHPEDRELVRARMEQTRRTGGTPAGVCRMLRGDGSVFAIEVEGMRLDFDGEPSNVVMGHDVTERAAMFARMALADRMLSIGTLAAGVAHEINNPLAYISTNVDVLGAELPRLLGDGRSRLSDATLRTLLADVRDGVDRVSTIVRELRALSRPSDEAHGPIDLVAVLGSSIKMAQHEIRHRARVVQDYAVGLPLVAGDASRLGQVFLNLLLNGAQAIPAGSADQNEIRVRAFAAPTPGRICVEIEDTGTGIPPNIVPRIFDPFFTTKAPGAGIGLGLAISHQILRSMDGEITVASTLGHGSTFRITLPVATTTTEHRTPEALPAPAVVARILLIDDEAAVGRSLTMLLAPNDVVVVTRAGEALARLTRGERFDAIICDLMMPEVTGIEFYDQVARLAPAYTGRIIFMTGGAFTPRAHEFLTRLERPHLQKPFTEDQVRRAIAAVAG